MVIKDSLLLILLIISWHLVSRFYSSKLTAQNLMWSSTCQNCQMAKLWEDWGCQGRKYGAAKRGMETCQWSSQKKRDTLYQRSQGGCVYCLIHIYWQILCDLIGGKLLMAPVLEGDDVVSIGVVSDIPGVTGKKKLYWLYSLNDPFVISFCRSADYMAKSWYFH